MSEDHQSPNSNEAGGKNRANQIFQSQKMQTKSEEEPFEYNVFSKHGGVIKDNTQLPHRKSRSLLDPALLKTGSKITSVGSQIGMVIKKINPHRNVDKQIQEVFEGISKNYEAINKNYNAIINGEVNLETNVPIKLNSTFMRRTLLTLEQTKNEMRQELSKFLETMTTSDIHSTISQIVEFAESFANDVGTFYNLSQKQRIAKLQEGGGILKKLEDAGSFKLHEETLHSRLYKLVDFGYANPKDADDKQAFAALSALYYGSRMHVALMFFLMDLYSYIVNYFYIVGDIDNFDRKFSYLDMNFSHFKRTLVFRIGNDPLLYRVIENLNRVTSKYFISYDTKQLLEERIEYLENIIQKIRKIDLPIIDRPRQLVPHIQKPGNIDTNIKAWNGRNRVSYAIQYKKADVYSDLGDWSEEIMIYKTSKPYITVPAGEAPTRLIFRRFQNEKPQLVAVLENKSQTRFRDIHRDLYNTASELHHEALDEADILVQNGGDVNKVFDQGRRAIHVAAESGNTKFAQKFLLANSTTNVNVRDVNGHTPTFVAADGGKEEFVELLVKNEADVNIGRYSDNLNPLHVAAFKGYVPVATALMLSQTVDVNAKDVEGFTALHNAVFGGVHFVTALTSNSSVDVDAKSKEGLTPLHLATINENTDVVEVLLKTKKADINAAAKGKLTALHIASALGHVDMVKFLTSQNETDINAKFNENWTPLHFAVCLKKEDVAFELLKTNNIVVNFAADGNITPLHIAATTGQNSVLLRLLENKASIEEKTEGLSALHLAAMNGNQEVISTLLSHGADITVKTFDGLTPLHLATSSPNSNLNTIKLLINKGADLNNIPNSGETFLHLAARSGILDNVMYFVEKKYNVNAKDKLGMTPLHCGAESGQLDVVEYLISKGADITAKSNDGKILLHFAVSSGNLKTVKYFADKRAIDVGDEKGYTPLFIAAQKNYTDITKYLMHKTKADIDAKYEGGKTILHIAASSGNSELTKYILRKYADVYAKDDDGFAPLVSAARNGDLNIMKLFNSIRYVDFNTVCNFLARPLAAYHGHLDIVKHLADKENGMLLTVNNLLSVIVAVENGHLDVVKYLTETRISFNIGPNEHSSFFIYNYPRFKMYVNGKDSDVSRIAQLIISVTNDSEAFDHDKLCSLLLLLSVAKNHLGIVKYLIDDKQIDVNVKSKNGDTLLHYAAAKGNMNIVKYLTDEKHVNLNAENDNGMTSILFATKNNNFDVVKFLDEKGALRNSSRFTNLDFAASNGNLDMAKYFIKKGDNVNANSTGGLVTDCLASIPWIEKVNIENSYYDGTPLSNAAKNDHLEMVKYLIKIGGNINFKTENGNTPLYHAIKNGNFKMVKYLIKKGASLTSTNNFLLHIAAENGHLDIVKYLVDDCHVNVNLKDVVMHTPVYYAAINGHLDIVKYLVNERDANYFTTDSDGVTLMENNVKNGQLNTIRYLIEKGANFNNNILHKASGSGHVDIVKYFVEEKHIDVNVIDKSKRTPLHYAVSEGHLDVVKYLLTEKHADLNIKDAQGKTALQYAVLYPTMFAYIIEQKGFASCNDDNVNICLVGAMNIGRLNLVKHLVEKKRISVNLKYDIPPRSLLQHAMVNGHFEIVKYLLEAGADVNTKYTRDSYSPNNVTSLHIAAANGSSTMVDYLLTRGADVNAKGEDGFIPWKVAGMCCNIEIGHSIMQKGGRLVQRNAEFGSSTTEIWSSGESYPSIASGSSSPSSWINSFTHSIVNTFTGVSQSIFSMFTPAIDIKHSQHFAGPANVTIQHTDACSVLILLDIFARKFTAEKYISTAESSISLMEATSYALRITDDFEEIFKQAAKKNNISLDSLNIDFTEIQKYITRKLFSGKSHEIYEVLRINIQKVAQLASKANNDKFTIELNEKVDRKLNNTMGKLLCNRNRVLGDIVSNGQQIILDYKSNVGIAGSCHYNRINHKQGV